MLDSERGFFLFRRYLSLFDNDRLPTSRCISSMNPASAIDLYC